MHIPVLRGSLCSYLTISPGDIVVDCTTGLGGHTEFFSARVGSKGKVIAIEWDRRNFEQAQKRLATRSNIIWVRDNYKNIYSIINKEGFVHKTDVVFFDLGVSSPHLDEASRGFSYLREGRLDMRFDQHTPVSAHDVINTCSQEELSNIFHRYGEEPAGSKIAKKIVEYRKSRIINTTTELSDVVRSVFPIWTNTSNILARIFQALRIHVNNELENLTEGLNGAFQILRHGGRIAVLSYHSLEDRIVKHSFKTWASGCTCPPSVPICICHKVPLAHIITKKPILPSPTEIQENKRAKSAKLRILQKI